jgi:AcrR family transcriptional regulator
MQGEKIIMKNLSRREKEKRSREEDIIAAAEKVFCQKGFEGATMDEIAETAQFTKRTLYQYFLNKEDLYFAVALKGFTLMSSYSKAAMEKGQTGYEKIYLAGKAHYQFFKDHQELLHFMTGRGYVKLKGASSHRLKAFAEFDNAMFTEFSKVIEEGKKDGTIRSDLDANKGAYTIAFMTTAFFNQLSLWGTSFTRYFGSNPDDFVNYTMELLGDSFRVKK